jgi:hypothetical protein
MEVIKQNIKFSNLPKEQKKVEVDIVAYDLKFTFANEKSWQDCSDKEYKQIATEHLKDKENLDDDCYNYALIQFKNGKYKWIKQDEINDEQENESLGIY